MKTLQSVATATALLLLGCAEEATYTMADLVAHLEGNGAGVEETLDLAEMGAPSAASGGFYHVTLDDDTELLVHVTEDARIASRIVDVESQGSSVARRMGVGDADTYTTGIAYGNLAVLIQDGTDPARVEELRRILEP